MKKLLALVLALSSVCAHADMFQPSMSCSKPFKPFKFTSQWEVDSFKRDVEAYERCVERFIDEQRTAAKTHSDAANNAVREFNSYIRSLR